MRQYRWVQTPSRSTRQGYTFDDLRRLHARVLELSGADVEDGRFSRRLQLYLARHRVASLLRHLGFGSYASFAKTFPDPVQSLAGSTGKELGQSELELPSPHDALPATIILSPDDSGAPQRMHERIDDPEELAEVVARLELVLAERRRNGHE
jgi:hypothetical protein